MNDQPLAPSATDAATQHGHDLSYDGQMGEIGKIALMNGLLGVFTLGIYRFWGKTRLRRYLWSHTALDDERVEYAGRGLELFIGFLIAGLVLGLLFAVVSVTSVILDLDTEEQGLLQLVYVLILFLLIPIAIYRARRYILSRSHWRGIRAGQTGSALKYALMSIGLQSLVLITLSLAYPYYRTVLQRYRTQNTWFGDQRFAFDGRAGALFGKWVIALLLYPFTLGFSYFWYRTVEFRYFAGQTRFMGATFNSDLETGRVIGILILNALAMLMFLVVVGVLFNLMLGDIGQSGLFDPSLAGASPVAAPDTNMIIGFVVFALVVGVVIAVLQTILLIHPMVAAVIDSLEVKGAIDFEALAQSARRAPSHGEGLADAFDLSPI